MLAFLAAWLGIMAKARGSRSGFSGGPSKTSLPSDSVGAGVVGSG